MIAPINIRCPYCKEPPGTYCTSPTVDNKRLRVLFHHAERVDAALCRHDERDVVAERASMAAPASRYVFAPVPSDTRAVVKRMRSVYETAIDWRKHLTLVTTDPYTQRLLDVIDAAIDAEEALRKDPA